MKKCSFTAFAVGFVNVKIRMRSANVKAEPLNDDWR